MSLVFAGICSHAPGITGRADRADPKLREGLCTNFEKMRQGLEKSGAEALVVVAAEHFANFFMDNMPAFCMGMADYYEGPIEDEKWLGIKHHRIPGNSELSNHLITNIMQEVDLSYAQEWKFDHGIMVPLHFLTPNYDIDVIPVNINCQGPPLTPLQRSWAFGEALRRACDSTSKRIAIVGTGGISHWPATPDSGKINENWDRDFLDKWENNRKEDLLAYTDEQVYAEAGQGGFEIRTFISIAAACGGQKGNILFYAPIPIYAVGCTVATMKIA